MRAIGRADASPVLPIGVAASTTVPRGMLTSATSPSNPNSAFRGLRGFLGIFRVLADFGNLTNICFHGLLHGVTSLLGISLFAQVLHISSIAHSVPKPSAPAISPSFATNQSKPDQTTDDATRPHR